MKHWVIPLAVALLAVGTGSPAAAQGQSQGQAQGQRQDQDRVKGQDGGQHQAGPNHGRVVSECNHRANERKLQGQERKDYTEWCESRGARYQYDHGRYDGERSCYQEANRKGLSGDRRGKFLDKCFAEPDRNKHTGGKSPANQKD